MTCVLQHAALSSPRQRSAMLRCRSLLVLCLAWAVVAYTAQSAKVPLGCTVIMYKPYDYTVVNGRSRCIQTVENARETCGGSRMNFVPSLFFATNAKLMDDSKVLKRYCPSNDGFHAGTTMAEPYSDCVEFNANSIKDFRVGMTACFKRAVQLGFTTLEVTPHMDDAANRYWRNSVQLSPTQKYGRYSYVDVMIKPLAAAFHSVLSAKVKVYFSMQGEMGATVIRKAKDWIPVVKGVRALVTRKDKARFRGNVKVGISTNWDKLCGCGSDSLGIDPDVYINNFEKHFAQVAKDHNFNITAIRTLYNTVDFVGTSYYPYKAQPLTPAALEYGIGLFTRELALYGIDLAKLIKKGTSFRLHEYGLGGGLCGEGHCPAPTGHLMQWPFFGIGGSYTKALDPFKRYNPKGPQLALLRKFYRLSLRWFSKSGGPRFKFDAVYLWNSGSWDVTGTNPSAASSEGSWREPFTQRMIKAYNDRGIVP